MNTYMNTQVGFICYKAVYYIVFSKKEAKNQWAWLGFQYLAQGNNASGNFLIVHTIQSYYKNLSWVIFMNEYVYYNYNSNSQTNNIRESLWVIQIQSVCVSCEWQQVD